MPDLIAYLLVFLRNDFIWLELILLPVALAMERPALSSKATLMMHGVARVASGRFVPYLALIALALIPRLLLSIWITPPTPYTDDEFSHLFLADTLLAGRLSNPTHPLWQHFETLMIFHTPTYSSMYMPGQGLFLAAGKLLTGWHWGGVLAGAIFAVASMLWALRALFPPEWAFLGAAFYVCRATMFSAWTEGFWGGHVAAGAGALLIGSVVRLRRAPDLRWAAYLALAVTLLAWTRPFEGFVLTATAGVFLAAAFLRSQRKRDWARLVLAPGALLLSLTALATGTYFRSVTGSPFKMPYAVNRETYGWPMTLPWLEPKPVQHRHKEHQLYYAWELSEHQNIRRLDKIPAVLTRHFTILFSFYLGPLMAWPLLRFCCRRRFPVAEKGLLLTAAGAMLAALLIEQTVYPHYAAPGAVLLYALVTAAWRATPERPKLFNTALTAGLVLAAVFVCRAAEVQISPFWPWNSWCDAPKNGRLRAAVQQQIEQHPGGHVAIVKYNRSVLGPSWVFNSPDIDSQRVIWAQDMGERNQELLQYYPDRIFWIVEPDAKPPRVTLWKTPGEKR